MADLSSIKLPNNETYNIKDATARTDITGKVSKSGDTMTGNLTVPTVIPSGRYGVGTSDQFVRPYIERASANRLLFLPANQIIIEQTVDGGSTWTSYGASDDQKRQIFTNGGQINIPLINNERSTLCGIRITFTAMKYNVPSGTAETSKYNYWSSTYVSSQERYTSLDMFWFWLGAQSDRIRITAERATGASPSSWSNIFNTDFGATGWSGADWIKFSSGTFGGATSQTTNIWNYRITFFSRYQDGKTAFTGTDNQRIYEIQGFGENVWGAPNSMMYRKHLYTYDADQNATFPAKVSSTEISTAKINGVTVGSNPKFTDTTYESKAAASGGAAVSLVTTGEKYTWNNKITLPSSASAGQFLVYDGSAWVAQSLSTWQAGSY